MSYVDGSVAGRQNIWFRPVSLQDARRVVYLDAAVNQATTSNRNGYFRVSLSESFYAYYLEWVYQYVVKVPAGGASYNVGSLKYEVAPGSELGPVVNLFDSDEPVQEREHVNREGDSMTGPLVLADHPSDQSSGYQAATKKFVEDHIAAEHVRPRHVQNSPSNHWVFAHLLGYNPPFTVTDLNGQKMISDERYLTSDIIEVFHTSNESGYIELHG